MKKTIPIIFAAILAVVLVASACVLLFTCYIQQTVAYGVRLSALPLEGNTLERAKEKTMMAAQGLTEKPVVLTYSNVEVSLRLADIGAKIDWEDAVNQAYLLGKNGSVFLRCKDILAARLMGTAVYPTISYDEEKLNQHLASLQKKIKTPVKEATYREEDGFIVVTAGEKGEVIDREQLMHDLLDALLSGTQEPVALATKKESPAPISVEALADEFFKDPVNARYQTENGEITIIPDEDGVSFDKESAAQLLKDKKTCKIPLVYTKASVTYADLDTNILKDTIATYTTSYGSGDDGRNYNVELAAQRLNGIILEAGETFSFLERVGGGTTEQGFRPANVYSRGELKQAPGGGLCQAASTLYSAALYANLHILSRTAHTLPVSYIPAGQDAEISADGVDLQFQNTSLFPIRILAAADGSNLTITIQGTNANPDQTVTINNSVTETIPYHSKTVMTDRLEAGKQEIIQNGTDGSVVNTYRIITRNGETVQNDMISTSRYEPVPKVIREGVSSLSPSPSPTP